MVLWVWLQAERHNNPIFNWSLTGSDFFFFKGRCQYALKCQISMQIMGPDDNRSIFTGMPSLLVCWSLMCPTQDKWKQIDGWMDDRLNAVQWDGQVYGEVHRLFLSLPLTLSPSGSDSMEFKNWFVVNNCVSIQGQTLIWWPNESQQRVKAILKSREQGEREREQKSQKTDEGQVKLWDEKQRQDV